MTAERIWVEFFIFVLTNFRTSAHKFLSEFFSEFPRELFGFVSPGFWFQPPLPTPENSRPKFSPKFVGTPPTPDF